MLGVKVAESTRMRCPSMFKPPPLGGKTHFFGLPGRIVLGVVETIELQGEWIGHYPGHFDEVIRIEQNGDEVEAIKITGDDYVPAGAVTWRANLRTMEGEGQIAEMEFQHARFVPGRLVVVNPERIIFHWANCGEVEFRKDD
jgi:predicted RNA-binding protein